ncbi:MAG: MFS transporter, partial [Treponema sp.]|nr:MFS transporter [Treponema sp.]
TKGMYKGVFTKPFFLASLGLFSGTFSGLLVNGNLIPISIELGLSKEMALISISIFASGNFAGRIFWGHIFDRIGFKSILLSLFGSTITAITLVFHSPALFILALIGLLGFFFGSNFVIYAAAISKYFGSESFASLYPICFLFYGLAGIIGPGMGGYLADLTGYYRIPLYINIAILAMTGIIILLNSKAFVNKPIEHG